MINVFRANECMWLKKNDGWSELIVCFSAIDNVRYDGFVVVIVY